MWNMRREEQLILLLLVGAFAVGLGIKFLGAKPAKPPLPPPPLIRVKIYGAVKNPGYYKVPENFPVKKVIEKAGGYLPWADLSNVNLSSPLPSKTLFIPEGKLNINRALAKDLTYLPGIGEELARRIINHRKKIGKFTQLSQLKEVPGIGEVRFQKIKDKLTLDEEMEK